MAAYKVYVFTVGAIVVPITTLLLPPTIGMERADKTATSTELSALQASTYTRVTEGGSARAFKTAPVVTLFYHCGNLAFDRQQRVTLHYGVNQIAITFRCEVHPILCTHFFQCLQTCYCVCSGWAIRYAARIHYLTTFDAKTNHEFFQQVS